MKSKTSAGGRNGVVSKPKDASVQTAFVKGKTFEKGNTVKFGRTKGVPLPQP